MNKMFVAVPLLLCVVALPTHAQRCKSDFTPDGHGHCMPPGSAVDLEHPRQQGDLPGSFPLELKEFKNIIGNQLPSDVTEIWAEHGACAESNNWTPVRNAESSFGCRVYSSHAQGSKWKGVYKRAEGGKGYKLFKLLSYLDTQGKTQWHWVLQVDRKSNGDLYAVNGNTRSAANEGNTPEPANNVLDTLMKGARNVLGK